MHTPFSAGENNYHHYHNTSWSCVRVRLRSPVQVRRHGPCRHQQVVSHVFCSCSVWPLHIRRALRLVRTQEKARADFGPVGPASSSLRSHAMQLSMVRSAQAQSRAICFVRCSLRIRLQGVALGVARHAMSHLLDSHTIATQLCWDEGPRLRRNTCCRADYLLTATPRFIFTCCLDLGACATHTRLLIRCSEWMVNQHRCASIAAPCHAIVAFVAALPAKVYEQMA